MNDSIGGLNHGEHFAAQARSSADAASLRKVDSEARAGRADEAEKGLERLFHKMLVKEMRKGLGEGFFGTGPGADTYADWFDDHLAEGLTDSNAIDLGPLLEGYRAELVQESEESESAEAEGSEAEPSAPERAGVQR